MSVSRNGYRLWTRWRLGQWDLFNGHRLFEVSYQEKEVAVVATKATLLVSPRLVAAKFNSKWQFVNPSPLVRAYFCSTVASHFYGKPVTQDLTSSPADVRSQTKRIGILIKSETGH